MRLSVTTKFDDMPKLKSDCANTRRQAVNAFGKHALEAIVSRKSRQPADAACYVLLMATLDVDFEVRMAAFKEIQMIRIVSGSAPQAMVAAVVLGMRDPNPKVRLQAARCVRGEGIPEYRREIALLKRDGHPEIRELARTLTHYWKTLDRLRKKAATQIANGEEPDEWTVGVCLPL